MLMDATLEETGTHPRPATGLFFLHTLLVAGLILYWASSTSPYLAFDDAYITFRYASNFRDGLGLIYNPGEPVLGTTTPLFAILLGLLGRFIPDLEWLAFWTGIAGWIVAAWAVTGLLRLLGRPRAALVAGLLIALQPSMLRSISMETPLVVALMFLSAWAWLGERRALAISLMALSLLLRLDSALWLLLAGLAIWWRERRLPWSEAVSVLLLCAPWFLYASLRYGSILPNSALAKIGQNESMGVTAVTETFAPLFLRRVFGWAQAESGLLLLLFTLAGVLAILHRQRWAAWLPLWLVLYVLIYQSLGVVPFPWYFVPPTSVLLIVVAVGAGTLLGDGEGPLPGRAPILLPSLAALFVAWILFANWQQMATMQATRANPHVEAYRAAGEWLRENTPPGSRVAALEIGIVGYLSERPILDTMGLVSPEMEEHLVGWTESLVYAMTVLKPDYGLAVLGGTSWDWLVGTWWFQEQYRPVATMDEVRIYQRVPPQRGRTAVVTGAVYDFGIVIEEARLPDEPAIPGQPLDLFLTTRVEEAIGGHFLFATFLDDVQSYERVIAKNIEPFEGGYATSFWHAGDLLDVPLRLELPPELAPGAYRLGFSLYDVDNQAPVIPTGREGGAEVEVAWIRVGDPPVLCEPTTTSSLLLNHLRWQDGIRLVAASIPRVQAGKSEIPICLRWEATASPEGNFTVFIHLLDETGNIITQVDRRPSGGRFPTSVWQNGEMVDDLYLLPIPVGLPEGRYDVRLGLYDDRGRLPLAGGGDDSLLFPGAVIVE